jgi:hypothetical protein
MIPATTLALSGIAHNALKQHLFPGDGLEAAAVLLCTRTPGPRARLLARDVLQVPYGVCRRERQRITWPGDYLELAIDRAAAEDMAIILVHSHPGRVYAFSAADDQSDMQTIPSLFQAAGTLHGTAIMTPDGAMRARLYGADLQAHSIELVTVAGDDLNYWWDADSDCGAAGSRPMAFTRAMSNEVALLSATVIGASGTGSIVGEQVARIGFGRIWTIDFDRVEVRNLNRILNATVTDAKQHRLKVEVLAAAIASYRGEGVARPVAASILSRDAVLAASQSDIIFSCSDTLEARMVADLIGAAFLLPVIDVGVTIPLRRTSAGVAIGDVCGRIDYVQPGRSTLADRRVYTAEALRAEYLRKTAPDAHRQELEAGYIKGLIEEAPSVITLNMRAASAAVNEFIARAYPYRIESNANYARSTFSLAACEEEFTAEAVFDATPNSVLGRGSLEPLLGLPALRTQLPSACHEF